LKVDGLPITYNYKINYPDQFLEKLKEGKVVATRCVACNSVYFPPQKDCSNCGSDKMEWVELQGEGELMTYSIVSQKPQGFEKYPDYVIGIVRLGEVSVMAWIKGRPRVGSKVKISTDGQRIIAEVVE